MNSSNYDTRLTLLEKVKNRYSDGAWEEFVFYYQKYTQIVINSMSVTPEDAEELNQIVMIKLWEKLPDFKFSPKKASFRTWLCRVIRNEASNYFRKKRTLKRSLLTTATDEYLDIPCDSKLDDLVEREWNIYITRLALNNIMKTLPKRFRPAFSLHLEGKSIEEIIEETGLAYNTVSIYLKRSREDLKTEVKRLTNELL